MDARQFLTLDGTSFDGREREFTWLWVLATALYGVGDIVTTLAIGYSDGVVEGNLLVANAVAAFGITGLVGVKLAIFFLVLGVHLYAIGVLDDWVVDYAPPTTLALVGAFVTTYNVRLLVG